MNMLPVAKYPIHIPHMQFKTNATSHWMLNNISQLPQIIINLKNLNLV